MPSLTFVTGNPDKYITAVRVCAEHDLALEQASPDIDEVQSEDSEYIARHKAGSAFETLGKPVVVSDDSWSITGLHGFPGPYMKSMNHWLGTEDFLRLTAHLTDRSVILTQQLVYYDGSVQKLFSNQTRGAVLDEPRGPTEIPWASLVALDGDQGMTIAEVRSNNLAHSDRDVAKNWHDLIIWYKENM